MQLITRATMIVVIAFATATASFDARSKEPRSVFLDCSGCPEMVIFASDNRVSSTIAVSSTPITFSQWLRCVNDRACDGYRPDRQGWSADTPVVNVSFHDAQGYIEWLSKKTGVRYRLPRESEWASLALGRKGKGNAKFPWGNQLGKGNTNCLDCGSRWDGLRASPVRSFKANSVGLYDIAGNVAHWVEADIDRFERGTSHCKEKRDYAAIMGASWADPSKYLGVNEWACFPKVLRDDTIGFRVVREIP